MNYSDLTPQEKNVYDRINDILTDYNPQIDINVLTALIDYYITKDLKGGFKHGDY